MNRLLILGLVASLAMGCENRCEPGTARVLSGSVRNPSNPSVGEPIDVLVQLGECAADSFPTPAVIGSGEGRTVTGSVLETTFSYSPSKVEQEMSLWLDFRDAPSGWLDIVLRFPSGDRAVRIYNASTLKNAVHLRTLNGRCGPPVRNSAAGMACTELDSLGPGRVFEQSDGGLPFRLDVGSALWSTAEGHLITTPSGVGWLAFGARVEDWRSEAPLSGEVFHVAADPMNVFVLQAGVLRVFSKNLATELPSVVLATQSKGFLQLAGDSVGILRAEGLNGGTLEMLVPEATSWSSTGLQAVDGTPAAAGHAAGLWTCGPKVMRWNTLGPSGVSPIAETEIYGACLSVAASDRPGIIAARNTFLGCPYLDGSSIRMVEVSAPSGSGSCFGNLVLLNYGSGADAWTEVFDIGAALP